VKYDALNNRWIYSSLYIRPSDGLQGLCVHRSTDDGASWTNPLEVTPAFVPNNFADKALMDIDAVTGRILISWTHFGASGPAIRTTFSDNGGVNWSPAVTVGTPPAGFMGVQGSVPRFGPGNTAYVAWQLTGAGRNVGFSRSTTDGAAWTAPFNLTTLYADEDQVLGIDRVNTYPSMAVDLANGRVYVVYQVNDASGTGDIGFQRSTDGGISFSPRILINSNPGGDRAQFYPWVTVDQSSGRVHVVWYDQDALATGDMTEQMHTSTIDGGITWSRPTPLVDRPFHAGYGNDTSQPNLGDYSQSVARNGVHHGTWVGNSVSPRFDEGQPADGSMFTPDAYHDATSDAQPVAALRLVEEGVVFTESNCVSGANGFFDPGEIGDFTFPIENYTTNPIVSPVTYTGVVATLSTVTPDVTIPQPTQSYGDVAPGSTAANAVPFQVQLAPSFVPGTHVDLALTVSTSLGQSTELLYRLATGSPGTTTVLLSEDFNGVAPPALPPNWTATTGTGAADPWVTSTALTTTNAAFHDNDGAAAEWMRLASPGFTVPDPGAGVESYLTVDFDVVANLEDDAGAIVRAFDGLFLRITDNTAGALVRPVLAEAFAERINTGNVNHYPKHLPRSADPNYFQDMSVWSGQLGSAATPSHVSMTLAGPGLVGRTIDLRFEYTEDSSSNCGADPCGVAVDVVVVRHVVSADLHCNIVPVELTGFMVE